MSYLVGNYHFVKSYSGRYILGHRIELSNSISVYNHHLQCEGMYFFMPNSLSNRTRTEKIDLMNINSICLDEYNRMPCIKLEYVYEFIGGKRNEKMLFFGFQDMQDCINIVNKAIQNRKDEIEQQLREIKQKELEEKQRKEEKKQFWNDCMQFHFKNNPPRFDIFSENNQLITIYIDENKALNFLKVNAEECIDEHGIIAYEKIHYYEKAGNIHYVSETNGSYSSFGGSLTGATFSKRAALFHGIMFGPMGLATAAMMSYKPAEQKPSETHFDISSETKRIDERNVILNFYSDDKKQYIDLELPQEIYNFLQTYLPEKKFYIVNELEKHSALQKSIKNKPVLEKPEEKKLLSEPNKISIDEFKEKVEKLKIMLEAGLLTDEEFAQEKKNLLLSI